MNKTYCPSCKTKYTKPLYLFGFCPVCKCDVKDMETINEVLE